MAGADGSSCHDLALPIPARLQRAGIEMRFVVEGDDEARPPDPALTRLLARVHLIRARILADCSLGVGEIAAQGTFSSYVTRLLRITFLAPDIVTKILAGSHLSA